MPARSVSRDAYYPLTADDRLEQHRLNAYFNLLMWQTFWLLWWVLFFFWADLIPGFGNAASLSQFGSLMSTCMGCFMGANGSVCPYVWAYMLIFNVGYIVSFVASADLNRESANFTMIQSVVIPIVVVVFFEAFPSINPTPGALPWWSVYIPLLLTSVGVFLWKRWEIIDAEEQSMAASSLREPLSTIDESPVPSRG